MLKTLKNNFENLYHLFFPNPCLGCGKQLHRSEEVLCLVCESELHITPFHEHQHNFVSEKFVGRAKVENATSMLLFAKEVMVQHLIHLLKYQGKTEVGIYLGKKYGKLLSKESAYQQIDCIVPVPLHATKKEKRGYNQSEYFAIGLAEALMKPVFADGLKRLNLKESQTRKKKFERWKNVEHDFDCPDELLLENKHILLVDDVLTTGATLDACCSVLNQIKNVKVSIATIAVVMK
jgi:ComF family protein